MSAMKAGTRMGPSPGEEAPRFNDKLIDFYERMLLIRRFEERAGEMYTRRKIGGFLHLYIGQEAVAVGAISALADSDYVLSHYREHGHILARGSPPGPVMAELFGRST